jgi:hypothetical protein
MSRSRETRAADFPTLAERVVYRVTLAVTATIIHGTALGLTAAAAYLALRLS